MTDLPRALNGRQPQAIRSALAVLRAVAQAGPGITARQISADLGLPPATTYRILNLLVDEEYVVRLGDLRGFALGARAAELVGLCTDPDRRDAEATLDALRAATGLPVTLARYSDRGMQIALADPRRSVNGLAAANLHASALGRLLLAATPDWRALLPGRDLTRLTPKTITDSAGLEAELRQIHRDGFAVQFEQVQPRLGCLAVPVHDAVGRLRASLAVSADCDVLRWRITELVGRLRDCAAGINPQLIPEATL